MISGLTLVFVNVTDLTIISAFASSTFLMVFAAVNLAAFRLRERIRIRGWIPLAGLVSTLTSLLVLLVYLARHDARALMWLGIFYVGTVLMELLFCRRAIIPLPSLLRSGQ